jgi:hypothetical protein
MQNIVLKSHTQLWKNVRDSFVGHELIATLWDQEKRRDMERLEKIAENVREQLEEEGGEDS